MRTMNRLSFLAALAFLSFGCGCVTSPSSPEGLQAKAKAVAWVASVKVLESHPEWRPQMEAARNDLQLLAASEEIGLVEVLAIVHRLPIEEFRSGDAAIIITGAMLFFEDELGRVALDNPDWLRAVVRGMITGMTLAGVGSP